MVGYRTEYHPILHLRMERPLPKKLVRSQAGLVGVAYVRSNESRDDRMGYGIRDCLGSSMVLGHARNWVSL